MNNTQLSTIEEARSIAQKINASGIGGGIKPEADDQSESGIYLLSYGYYAPPSDGENKFYHFRFQNNAEGFNVGLVRQTMRLFPNSWPANLALEVNRSAANAALMGE